jgi:hypothetical protein
LHELYCIIPTWPTVCTSARCETKRWSCNRRTSSPRFKSASHQTVSRERTCRSGQLLMLGKSPENLSAGNEVAVQSISPGMLNTFCPTTRVSAGSTFWYCGVEVPLMHCTPCTGFQCSDPSWQAAPLAADPSLAQRPCHHCVPPATTCPRPRWRLGRLGVLSAPTDSAKGASQPAHMCSNVLHVSSLLTG